MEYSKKKIALRANFLWNLNILNSNSTLVFSMEFEWNEICKILFHSIEPNHSCEAENGVARAENSKCA
jgi:hypothetical protein